MSCPYCQWGAGTKKRSPFLEERVKLELFWLLTHRVRTIVFIDPMFGYNKRIAESILDHVINEKRRLGVQTRLMLYHNQDYFDPKLFDLYREAGAFVEIDLQSTNPCVLTRLGRQRWDKERFTRHLAAFREHRVQTTGSVDLMIGLPRDDLRSFEESVDFLLHRHMRISPFFASILPGTEWSRTIEEDGAVSSPIPPRHVFFNVTFPLKEMVAARLLGHGLEFFNNYPWTAKYLWQLGFDRPVDLCRAVGDAVYRRLGLMYEESHLYGQILVGKEQTLVEVVRDLCPDGVYSDLLADLVVYEAALHRVSSHYLRDTTGQPYQLKPVEGWTPSGDEWLQKRPRFRRDLCEQFALGYRVDELVEACRGRDSLPPLDQTRKEPAVALVFNDGGTRYVMVDVPVTYRLLQRFNGFFTVEECLQNLDPDWGQIEDLSPLWEMLSHLASVGVIGPMGSGHPSGEG